MVKQSYLCILFFVLTTALFSQQKENHRSLLQKAEKNYELLRSNPEKAFQVAIKIREQAEKENNNAAELQAITTQSIFYRINNDFENMLITSKLLFNKAKAYDQPVYQTIAKIHLSDAYNFNKLHDNSLRELEQGLEIIHKNNLNDSLGIITKMDLYVSYSNYYLLQKDYENQLKYIKLFGVETGKFSDAQFRKKLQYIYTSNLAEVYNNLGKIDSAEFFAKRSLDLDDGKRSDVKFSNYLTLGKISIERGDYEAALHYSKQAEKIEGYKNHFNILLLYENIIKTYQGLQDYEQVKLYEAKRDSFSLSISENQNKSLHTLLNEKEKSSRKRLIPIIIILWLVTFLGLFFFFIRKKRILRKQEEISEDYLKQKSGETYSMLIELLKNNDAAFVNLFSETFPDFSEKILQINPKMVQSEIEFCALLKMKIPTKEIAQYKFIEPKTVRNKKSLIRKKLNIPIEVDIYQWFDKL